MKDYKRKARALGMLVSAHFGRERSVVHVCEARGHEYMDKPRKVLDRGGCLYCSLERGGWPVIYIVEDSLPTVRRWRLKFASKAPRECLWSCKYENGLEAYLAAEEIDAAYPKFRKYVYRVNPLES